MRWAGRGAVAAIGALVAGFVVSLVFAAWLRSASPDAGFLWRAASPAQVAGWTMTGSHGAAVHVDAGVDVQSDGPLGQIGDRLGRVLDDSPLSGIDFRIRLAALTVLAVIGLVLVMVMRTSAVATVGEAATGALVAGGVHGVGLALIAASTRASLGFDGRLVKAGLTAGVRPASALVAGFVWGGVFAFAGAVSASPLRDALSPVWRAVRRGVVRASLVAAVTAIACLVLLGISQSGSSGGLPSSPAAAPLGVMLAVNIIGAAAVLSHGPHMLVAFTAGPLARFSRIGYLPGGSTLSPGRFVFVLVPCLATFFAGRAMRDVPGTDRQTKALAFGAVWAAMLAALALLLRVEVLSDFSIGSLAAGGGASINPFVALLAGFAWGTIGSYIGIGSGSVPAVSDEPVVRAAADPATAASVATAAPPVAATRRCSSCGAQVPTSDAFCGSCGRPL